MLHGESVESDSFLLLNGDSVQDASTVGADLIKMTSWHNIKLSEIWISSDLLPNRQAPIQLHREKPIPFRTLEKPSLPIDSLSTYKRCTSVADCSNFSSEEKWIDSLEEGSFCQLQGNNFVGNKTEDTFEDDSLCQEASPSNSIPDLLEHLCMSDSDTEEPITQIDAAPISSSPVNATNLCKKIDFLDKSPIYSAELVNDTEMKREIVRDFDYNENKYCNDSVINVSKSDYLIKSDYNSQEIYISDYEDEINEHCNRNLIDTFEKTIETPNEVSQCDFELMNDINKLPNELEIKNITEEVPYFPIPYQRPKEDIANDSVNDKRKFKKEKKVKKKNPRNVVLENFFRTKNEIPRQDNHEFFERVTGEKYGANTNFLDFMETYPSLDNRFPIESNYFEVAQESEQDVSVVTEVLKVPDSTPVENVSVVKDVKDKSQNNLARIVIENIPLNIDEKMLRSVVQDYGEIVELSIRKYLRTKKAEITMSIEDPDWIIDGLNESKPFGDFYEETIKCYKKE